MRYPIKAIELMFDCKTLSPVPNHWRSVKTVPFLFNVVRLVAIATFIKVLACSGAVYGVEINYRVGEFRFWIDEDYDCQLTNAEVLIATSRVPVTFKSSRKCKVDLGEWVDPFTNKVFLNNDDLDVMHIVGLKWAYENGAVNWSDEKRKQFANDPDNLLAVSDIENRKRRGNSFINYLPPNERYHCEFIVRFHRVVQKYGLNYPDIELRRAGELLGKCLR